MDLLRWDEMEGRWRWRCGFEWVCRMRVLYGSDLYGLCLCYAFGSACGRLGQGGVVLGVERGMYR